jgi:membrane-associated phospholipid phosphatase
MRHLLLTVVHRRTREQHRCELCCATVFLALLIGASVVYAQEPLPAFGLEPLSTEAAEAFLTETAASEVTSAPSSSSQAAEAPPEPAHTGLRALASETWGDFKAYPRRRSTWVILGVGGALALAVHPADQAVTQHLSESTAAGWFWAPGKYIGGVGMVIAPVSIYVIGRYVIPDENDPKTNKWTHLGFDLIRAQIVDEVLVQALKFSVQRTRPNGGNYSFPSGHAAATFAFASVLERHLGYRFAWPTVLLASYVATSRLHDNVHYLSDVVFGAALGTSVGWTVVGRHGRSNFALEPSVGPGSVALTLAWAPPH